MTPDVRSKNAYEVLGVPRDADAAAVRRAFRKLALRYHPDAVPEGEKQAAGEVFAHVNRAYTLLLDPDRRAHYDRLLDRGITPDLALEAGSGQDFASLAEILGEIQSLELDSDLDGLLAPVDRKLQKMLLSALVSGEGLSETVLDAIPLHSVPWWQGFDHPGGNLNEGWLIVTDLRLIALLEFKQETSDKIWTYWQAQSFPHDSLEILRVFEEGRAFRRYLVDVKDQQGCHLQLRLKVPQLSRLFLVANAYKLPLTVHGQGDEEGEKRTARWRSSLPLLGWLIPFGVYLGFSLLMWIGYVFSSDPYPYNFLEGLGSIYRVITAVGLTTLVLFLTPLLVALYRARLHRAWHTGRGDQITGPLPVDYALGVPADARREPVSPGREEPAPRPPAPEPRREEPAPAAAALELEVPEAVREAAGSFPSTRAPFDVPDPTPPPGDFRAALEKAVEATDRGEHETALTYFEDAVGLAPNAAVVWGQLGRCLALMRGWDEAHRSLGRAIELDPEGDPVPYFFRGLCRLELGDYQGSVEDTTYYLEADPNHPDAWYNRGLAWLGLGQPERAIADFDESLRVKPDDAQAHVLRGQAREAAGDRIGALRDYQQAELLWPERAAEIRGEIARLLKGMPR